MLAPSLSPEMNLLLAPFRLILNVGKRFHNERYAQTAAALSFTTLLGLVPMLAVAVALISFLPFGAALSASVEKFLLTNLLPDKAGIIITRYVSQFAHKGAHLTWLGIGALAITALSQMLTIEHTFNTIWQIKVKRPYWRRIMIHTLALLFGPVVFGGSLAAFTFVASASLGLVNEPYWINQLVLRGLPATLVAVFLGLLYWAIPNRRISVFHAGIGGVITALGYFALQRLFGMYLASFSTYVVVYGAFSAIPIFLLWLYTSWMIILIGALLTAELPAALRKS